MLALPLHLCHFLLRRYPRPPLSPHFPRPLITSLSFRQCLTGLLLYSLRFFATSSEASIIFCQTDAPGYSRNFLFFRQKKNHPVPANHKWAAQNSHVHSDPPKYPKKPLKNPLLPVHPPQPTHQTSFPSPTPPATPFAPSDILSPPLPPPHTPHAACNKTDT